jgi:hypothetical protein
MGYDTSSIPLSYLAILKLKPPLSFLRQSWIKNEISDIHDGDMYWISRRVLEDYISKTGIIGLVLYDASASCQGKVVSLIGVLKKLKLYMLN